MSVPSASTELEPADPESPSSLAAGGNGKGSGDIRARAVALIVGVLVGTFIGMGIGIGIGSATRKQLDRWTISY
jgi:hypothetical protein